MNGLWQDVAQVFRNQIFQLCEGWTLACALQFCILEMFMMIQRYLTMMFAEAIEDAWLHPGVS